MSRGKVRKGMLLSAGLGTRLLPITAKFPKPLVPVLNIPNVLHSLFLFKEAGIFDVILNLHHLGDAIERALGNGSRFGMRLCYSHESTLLGTGGGVKKAEPFFEGETFVLCNCDFVTNTELKPVIEAHFSNHSLATMLLLEDPARQSRYSKVGIDAKGHLSVFPKIEGKAVRSGIFTGIHVLDASLLKLLKPEPCGINEIVYPKLIRETPEKTHGAFLGKSEYWYDTGERPTLLEASLALMKKLTQESAPLLNKCLTEWGGYREISPGVWSLDKKIPAGVELRPPVILGRHIQFGKAARVGPFVALGDETRMGDGSSIEKSFTLAGSAIAPSAQIESSVLFESQVYRCESGIR